MKPHREPQYTIDGATLLVELPKGVILIDVADWPRIEGLHLSITTKGHATAREPCTATYRYLSRLIVGAIDGDIVQHRNGNWLDCRTQNLVQMKRYDVKFRVVANVLYITTKDGREITMDVEDRVILKDRRIVIDTRGYVRLVNPSYPYDYDKMARTIMQTPKNMYCDHIDGNPLNNRKSNLRNCTSGQNAHNRRGKRTSNNPFKGVGFYPNDSSEKKWEAKICVKGVRYFLGRFRSPEEAARAYDKKALELCGEYARVNVSGCPGSTVSALELEIHK